MNKAPVLWLGLIANIFFLLVLLTSSSRLAIGISAGLMLAFDSFAVWALFARSHRQKSE